MHSSPSMMPAAMNSEDLDSSPEVYPNPAETFGTCVIFPNALTIAPMPICSIMPWYDLLMALGLSVWLVRKRGVVASHKKAPSAKHPPQRPISGPRLCRFRNWNSCSCVLSLTHGMVGWLVGHFLFVCPSFQSSTGYSFVRASRIQCMPSKEQRRTLQISQSLMIDKSCLQFVR